MTYIPGREILIAVTHWKIPALKALLIAALVLFFILVPKGSSISIHALYGATFCYSVKTYLIYFFLSFHITAAVIVPSGASLLPASAFQYYWHLPHLGTWNDLFCIFTVK